MNLIPLALEIVAKVAVLPATCKVEVGEVVPMPTLPLLRIDRALVRVPFATVFIAKYSAPSKSMGLDVLPLGNPPSISAP